MKAYYVSFFKTVCNDRGDERKICQRRLTVEGGGEEQAIERAKALFCSCEGVSTWTLHSDAYEIECARIESLLGSNKRSKASARAL